MRFATTQLTLACFILTAEATFPLRGLFNDAPVDVDLGVYHEESGNNKEQKVDGFNMSPNIKKRTNENNAANVVSTNGGLFITSTKELKTTVVVTSCFNNVCSETSITTPKLQLQHTSKHSTSKPTTYHFQTLNFALVYSS